jgi:hypothetical protein
MIFLLDLDEDVVVYNILGLFRHPLAACDEIGLALALDVTFFQLLLAHPGEITEHGLVLAGLDLGDTLLQVLGLGEDVLAVDAPGQLRDVVLGNLAHAAAGAQPHWMQSKESLAAF